MKNYLNAIHVIALICIAGKAVSVSFGATDGGTNLSASFHELFTTYLLLTLLYFSAEFSVRFFIWPQLHNIHAIATFRRNVKDAVANTVEPEQEPIKEVSPLDTPKTKEVIAYTFGTFARVLTNEELMALESNLKVFILGKRDLEPAVNRSSKPTTTKTPFVSPSTTAGRTVKTSSKSKDAKASYPTPSASARSTNQISPPSG